MKSYVFTAAKQLTYLKKKKKRALYSNKCFTGVMEMQIRFYWKPENNDCKLVSGELKHKRKHTKPNWHTVECVWYPLAKQPPALMSHLSSHVVVFIGLIFKICSCILSACVHEHCCLYTHMFLFWWHFNIPADWKSEITYFYCKTSMCDVSKS